MIFVLTTENWDLSEKDILTSLSWLLQQARRYRESFWYRHDLRLISTSVQEDIITNLGMNRERILRVTHPFNRENLFYEVRYNADLSQEERMADVCQFIAQLHQRRGRPSSGIVYCRLRATCDDLARHLRRNGINARPYHRGLK